MKQRIKLFLVAACLVLTSVAGTLVVPSSASATSSKTLYRKYIAKGLSVCFTRMRSSIVADKSNITNVNGLFESNKAEEKVVGLPPDYDGSTDEYSCAQLLKKLGVSITSDDSEIASTLEKLGYEKDNKSKAVAFSFQKGMNNNTNFVSCTKDDKGKEQLKLVVSEVKDGKIAEGATLTGSKVAQGGGCLGYEIAVNNRANEVTVKASSGYSKKFQYTPGTTKWKELTDQINETLMSEVNYHNGNKIELGNRNRLTDSATSTPNFYNGMDSVTSNVGSEYRKKAESWKTAYVNLMKSDVKPENVEYSLSAQQKAALYSNFITGFYGGTEKHCAATKEEAEKSAKGADDIDMNYAEDANNNSGYHLTKLYKSDGTAQYCYVAAAQANKDKTIYGADGGGGSSVSMVADGRTNFASIAKWLLDNAPDKVNADYVAAASSSSADTSVEGEKAGFEINCFDNAGALGWILCPVITQLGETLSNIYSSIVEPFLNISPTLFTDTSGGTYSAWQAFQTFANIAFVAMFLFVIFSQLTGVGIDNYGIKRILPRLIVAALLMNLSYIICQLAVDVSNILGVSLRGLMENIPVQVKNPDITFSDVANSVTSTLLTVIIGYILKNITLTAVSAIGFSNIIVPVLLAFLGMIVAIVFFFIVLIVREAAVIVLVVLSPLAFACYMLPNTKNLFNRWLKTFESLLLVFPIAGLLMGGGDFVAKLLLNLEGGGSGNFFFKLGAALCTVVPFFFIPSLVRSSFVALGNIGNRISSLGTGFNRRVSHAVNNNDAVKYMRRRDAIQAASGFKFNRDGTIKFDKNGDAKLNRLGRMRARFKDSSGALGGWARQSTYRGQAALDKFQSEEMSGIESSLKNQDYWIDRGDDGGDRLARHFLDTMLTGNSNEIAAITNAASSGDKITRQAYARALSVASTAPEYDSARDKNIRRAINANLGDWKTHDASVAAWATRKDGESNDYDDYTYDKNDKLADKVTGRKLVNDLDDTRLEDIETGIRKGTISTEATEKYLSAIQEAYDAKDSGNLSIDGEHNDAFKKIIEASKARGVEMPKRGTETSSDSDDSGGSGRSGGGSGGSSEGGSSAGGGGGGSSEGGSSAGSPTPPSRPNPTQSVSIDLGRGSDSDRSVPDRPTPPPINPSTLFNPRNGSSAQTSDSSDSSDTSPSPAPSSSDATPSSSTQTSPTSAAANRPGSTSASRNSSSRSSNANSSAGAPAPGRRPLDSQDFTDLGERVRNAQVNPDGTLNIRGEGTFRQTDSGIIIPGRDKKA